ncbi:hypothetical protein EHV15_07705 [Paenibacillus oralis]|uniref:Uncharacterized protein n=1 Tax=Paenibacillus oralis TaxID=2490856 RepID=A0A3P3TYH8_9BACL|nr:hypothetical protein [Paenibacillus oralis]RRJ62834.1 hypothetical protein EHV15_07705 [Paenibacillus oralis]
MPINVIDHRQPFEPQLKAFGLHGVKYILVLNSPDQYLNELVKVVLPQRENLLGLAVRTTG